MKAKDCEVKSFDLWQWIVSQCLPRCQASLIMLSEGWLRPTQITLPLHSQARRLHMVGCWTRTSGLFPPRPLRSPFAAGQPIKTQPLRPPARNNWRNSSLRPQRRKLQLGRPQLWRLRRPPGAISSCWIWRLRTGPTEPRPPLDPVQALVLRAHAHRLSSRHSHLWQQQQAVAERREDDRRREEERREDDRRVDDRRRETERREDRREAAATAAAREARLEAVIANLSLLTAAPVATANMVSTAGFKPNRSFEGVSVFSGDKGQSFRH
jgi:hypothetical protein